MAALRERWLALTQRLSVSDGVAERWWRELSARYSEPGRYYHTLEHLRELLALSDAHALVIEERDALELAIWFHDVVYDARHGGGGKNERDSADALRRFAADAGGLDARLVDQVGAWIEATADHRAAPTAGADCRLFLDLDMMVLAREPAAYDAYAAQVRAEYRHVWAPVYWAARAAFLERAVRGSADGSAPIFHSAHFEHAEALARANAAREARTLRARLARALAAGAALAACAPLALGGDHLGVGAAARGAAAGACALAAGASAVHWFFARRGFVPFPYAGVPAGRVAVLAASFNPPHAGHLSLLRALSRQYEEVHAVVSCNPAKRYAASPADRRSLLAVMAQSAGLRNVKVVVHEGYVWRYAHATGADCLYRGIRSWAADGATERTLELLNWVGPLLLAPAARPLRTRFLGADPRLAHVSSSAVRRALAAGDTQRAGGMLPAGFASAVAQMYAPVDVRG
ncbi:hypothetical protein KFE25_001045 [Diacronema lutheri]|uniref:Cytidyltransferase-like domain-containing protein n=1 Tax=Diacronema lutheri TaxID=2081491 RepID=A0A8J5X5F2_DIALT|nr:hypothetical protein KFE25_001045 [Diacronema lutheri]